MKKTKIIESYLDGSLAKEEQQKIINLMAENEEFSSEIEFYKNINDSIIDDEVFVFRNNITTLFGKKKTTRLIEKTTLMKYLKYPVAATILALIGLSLFQIINLKSPEELYTNYYNPYQTDISTRSVVNSADKAQLSYILYQEGNFEVSFEILGNYLKKNLDDEAAKFYYALNAIELNKIELAKSELIALENNSLSPFSLHARWYLAMVCLKTEQTAEAKKYLHILSDYENIYSEKASKILKKLKS